MAVLIRAVVIAVLLAGCYAPDVRDCTVTCAAADDCAEGQVCGGGWCSASETAGTCGAPTTDASTGVDGAVAPDADPFVALHLRVEERGKLVVDPLGVECVGLHDHPGDCTFEVSRGSVQTLTPVNMEDHFEKWITPNCTGTEPCSLAMDADEVFVGAKFKH